MSNKTRVLVWLCCHFILTSCNNYTGNKKLDDFEFHISSHDNSGLIQLPDNIDNDKVIEITVTNKPKGAYEVYQVDFKESLKLNYVHYQAPSDTISFDQLHFRLLTKSGLATSVVANLSPIRDSHCQGSDPSKDYNFLLQNHKIFLKAGEFFKIQVDGLVDEAKASSSLIPDCKIIQDYGIRTTLLLELSKNKIFQSRLYNSYNYETEGIGFSHDMKDGPMFISGTMPENALPGTYKVAYSVMIHKLNDGAFLPNFKLYPAASWEWPEQLTVHKYGVIALDVVTDDTSLTQSSIE